MHRVRISSATLSEMFIQIGAILQELCNKTTQQWLLSSRVKHTWAIAALISLTNTALVPICLEWWCTEANEATQTHCYNPVAPAYPVWAYYAHGRQHRCQEDPVGPLRQTGEDNWVVPASRGSAPSNRICNTSLCSPKQQIWLRTALCGGWCQCMVLRYLRLACQKRRRRHFALKANSETLQI